MEPSEIKATLIDLFGRAQADQRELLAGISDAERAAIGTVEHWSIKDVVLHIAFWKNREVERLAAAARDQQPAELEDFEQVNARVSEEWRERPWQAVLDESERVFEALVAQVRAFDPEALIDPNRYAWQNGRPLLSSAVGNGFWHPESHIAQCYVDRGDLPRATRLQEELTEQLGRYGDRLVPRGEALYNLACFYAINGQAKRALALLPEALRLRPDLVEWSKEDTDLVSLHDMPAYQALYEV